MRKALTVDAANAVFDVLVEVLGAPDAGRPRFVARQTGRFVPSYGFTGTAIKGAATFGRGPWSRGKLSGERWAVDARGPRRPLNEANSALETLQSTHVGAWLPTLPLSPAQWAMLGAFLADKPAKTEWVDISSYDKRTYAALLSRRLVMGYPYGDRTLAALTVEGSKQVYSFMRRRRWESAGRVQPGEGYR